MTPEDPAHWRRVEEIFSAVLGLDPEDRAVRLARLCGADEALRREVEELLEADAKAEGFLEEASPDHPTALVRPRRLADRALAEAAGTDGRGGGVLSSGDVLAGRFRILRFLAAGGMGEVYEAEDEELGECVAIKTVRPEIAASPRATERFRREVHLARQVTHPGVCRTYDVFRHPLPSGSDSDSDEHLVFLSMELLDGESLQERIEHRGRLPPDEALDIVHQVADGLAAAHRAGIVHRDLKSANIVLVPARDGVRAVVTDFGLARAESAATRGLGGGTITAPGAIVGTPATMAPEQIEGGEITPATDVYALGVVMYEMVTGRLPFEAESDLAMTLKRLHEAPPSPRSHVADLDPRWERTILRCLEREPEERFADTREVVASLEGVRTSSPARRRRVAIVLAAVLGVVAVAALLLLVVGDGAPSDVAGPEEARPDTVPVAVRRGAAVVGFENLTRSEDTAWLATALTEMLTMELARGGELRMVPGESVARMRLDLELPTSTSLAPDTLRRVRRHLGADLLILGSYFAGGAGTAPAGNGGAPLRLDLRLEDVAAGHTLVLLTEEGTTAELLEIVTRVGDRLRGEIGLVGPVPGTSVALTSAPRATRLYAEGLSRLRLFDALGARRVLAEAARLDPSSPRIYAALAEAWTVLGHDAEAATAAGRALEIAEGLPRAERLRVEGRYHEAMKDWDQAVKTYRVLFGFFPDHLEDGLRLASVETAGGRGEAALETLAELRRLPSPAGEDPRIELEAATALLAVAEDDRARETAARAAARSGALGARWLLARARYLEGRALARLRNHVAAIAAAEAAASIYRDLGDERGLADTINLRANVAYFEHRLEDAEALYREALEIHRRLGSRAGMMTLHNNLANLRSLAGDLDGAEALYGEALSIAREISHAAGEARGLYNLGFVAWRRGDLGRARQLYETSLEIARRIGDRRRTTSCLNNLGLVLQRLGKLEEAEAATAESLTLAREAGNAQNVARRLGNLGHLRLRRGDIPSAARDLEEALALLDDLDDPGTLASVLEGLGRVALARDDLDSAAAHFRDALTLEAAAEDTEAVLAARNALVAVELAAGRVTAATTAAREIARTAADAGETDQELLARLHLAAALLREGDLPGVRSAAEDATALAAASEDTELVDRTALLASRLAVAEGDLQEARRHLEPVLAEARAAGRGALVLEARWRLLEIERAGGGDVRERLLELAADAETAGFSRLAGEAREAAGGEGS